MHSHGPFKYQKVWYLDPHYCCMLKYSVDLKARNIWNPDFVKLRFQMVQFSKVGLWLLPFENRTILNFDIFVRILNVFWIKWRSYVRVWNGWLPDFRSHSKSRPFANQPFFWPFEIQIFSVFRSCNYILLLLWMCCTILRQKAESTYLSIIYKMDTLNPRYTTFSARLETVYIDKFFFKRCTINWIVEFFIK